MPDPLKQEGELIDVPPAIGQLLQLCFQVAPQPEKHLKPWLNHIVTLRSQFGLALNKVKRAREGESPGSSAFQEFGEMVRGLDVILAGFDELESYKDSRETEILDIGWVNMMSGFKIFKQAGDRLALAPK